MRTTKATIFPFSWRLPQKDRTLPRPAVPGEAEREQRRILWHFLLGSVFLAGYLGGLWAGRTQEPEFGRSLALFYMDSSQYLAYGGVFGSLFSGSFLQLTTVLLMGFSALGVGLLPVFFSGQGSVLRPWRRQRLPAGRRQGPGRALAHQQPAGFVPAVRAALVRPAGQDDGRGPGPLPAGRFPPAAHNAGGKTPSRLWTGPFTGRPAQRPGRRPGRHLRRCPAVNRPAAAGADGISAGKGERPPPPPAVDAG